MSAPEKYKYAVGDRVRTTEECARIYSGNSIDIPRRSMKTGTVVEPLCEGGAIVRSDLDGVQYGFLGDAIDFDGSIIDEHPV